MVILIFVLVLIGGIFCLAGRISKIDNNPLVNTTSTIIQASSDNTKLTNVIVWKGKVATDLSQISGIKFWMLDDKYEKNDSWFWAYDENTLYLPLEAGGHWVSYLMKKFTGTSEYDYENDIFEIKGIATEPDCDYYERGNCIPNIEIIEIKRVLDPNF